MTQIVVCLLTRVCTQGITLSQEVGNNQVDYTIAGQASCVDFVQVFLLQSEYIVRKLVMSDC